MTMEAVRGVLGGLVGVLISLWALVGLLTKVDNGCALQRPENMQAPLEAMEFNMTVWNKPSGSFIGRFITATFEQQIDITMEKNISYHGTPLRDTPAAMETCVAKWWIQPPRRLLSRAVMLFQPWDVWIEQVTRHRQSQVYYARKENRNVFNATPAAVIHKSSANWSPGEPSRYYGEPSWPHKIEEELLRSCGAVKLLSEEELLPESWNWWRHRHVRHRQDDSTVIKREKDGVENITQMMKHMILDIPFDPTATEVCQASVVHCSVTQDIDSVRLEEEVFTDDIAGGPTREYLQFLRPWDIWLAHACRRQKGRVYIAREDEIERKPRSNKIFFTVATFGTLTGGNTSVEHTLGNDEEALGGSKVSKLRTYNAHCQPHPSNLEQPTPPRVTRTLIPASGSEFK